MPLVSILIPAYKAEKYLAEAVQSALAQTYETIEVIIVNDACPEGTGKLADELAKSDARIRVIHHDTNKLRSGALNTGIREARGQYVSFLDADDTYQDDKTEKQVAYLESNPELDAVYGDYRYQKLDGGLVEVDAIELSDEHYQRLKDTAMHSDSGQPAVFGDKYIPSCSPLIRKRVFEKVHFDESLTNAEDLDFWLSIIGAGFSMRRLPLITYTYRHHNEQKSRNTERMRAAVAIIDEKLRAGTYLK